MAINIFNKVKNRAVTTLAGALDNSTDPVTFSVATGGGAFFPTTADGYFNITINNEILKCTSRTTDSFTCARAQESTNIAAHPIGASVKLMITAKLVTDLNVACGAVVTKTDTYTADAAIDHTIVCDKSSAMTINLPAATGSGKEFIIKNINTGTVTLDGNSSDTIDGDETQSVYQWESVQIIDYAANVWAVL